MSRVPATYVSRPSLLDFFLVLLGCALSAFLARLQLPFLQEPTAPPSPAALMLQAALSNLLQLPDGIILLWPFFYLTQLALGRSRGMSAGEWLWLFAWLGNAALHTLALVVQLLTLPEGFRETAAALAPYSAYWTYWPAVVWYLILIPCMALIALIIAPFSAFSREPPPWTHYLGLALIVWPVLPLAGMFAAAKLA